MKIVRTKSLRVAYFFLVAAFFSGLAFGELANPDQNARKGFIENLKNGGKVIGAKGEEVFNAAKFSLSKEMLKGSDRSNPAVDNYRRLVQSKGLFEVIKNKIYQIRGLDISNISFIIGKNGLIVVDPLTSKETAKAALDQFYEYLDKNRRVIASLAHRKDKRPIREIAPVKAVIISHSHLDHFAGVWGVIEPKDLDAQTVKVYAPQGFLKEAVSENVLLGRIMEERAIRMYGLTLVPGIHGTLGSGLGLQASIGTVGVVEPTVEIAKTGEKLAIDGLHFIFQNASGAEAPAEFNFYIEDFKALFPAENALLTMHNILTPRGAKPRAANVWAQVLDETLKLFGNKAEVMFAPHMWPIWGKEQISAHLDAQITAYQFLHDQTVRMLNLGYGIDDISNMVSIPAELAKYSGVAEHYGTTKHNVRGIVSYYLGPWDGNPAELDPLGRKEKAELMIKIAGGRDQLLSFGIDEAAKGNLRHAVFALSKVVDAFPDDQDAKTKLAHIYKQIGLAADNTIWRNIYLASSQELNEGVSMRKIAARDTNNIAESLPAALMLNKLSTHLDPARTNNVKLTLAINFTDKDELFVLSVRHSVLRVVPDYDHLSQYVQNVLGESPLILKDPVKVSLQTLKEILLNRRTMGDALEAGDISASPESLAKLKKLLSYFSALPKAIPLATPPGQANSMVMQ